ncbi:lantibiotic dehydratase [Streptomyces sp. NPDC060232]|uniref:lantibiotic dehydratase n=1 Tax=Streptomyces sp. NPDC060232 TaxID=3347079 RepID=UPI00364DFA0E
MTRHDRSLPSHRGIGPALYEPLEWALVRAPLLPTDARQAAPEAGSDASLAPRDPLLRLALWVASPDLAAALERTGPQDRSAPRLLRKLRRYLIRMTTRPTPFGLFAGVSLARWAPATDFAFTPAASRTRTRADMGLLHDLTVQLDADRDISPHLRLITHPAILLRSGRATLTNGPGVGTSVRATSAVRRVLTAARTPICRADLEKAVSDAPGATPEKVGRLVEDLRAQGFLISELRPAPTSGDPVTRLRACLEVTPSRHARDKARELTRLAHACTQWDRLPLDQKAEHLPALLQRVGKLRADTVGTPSLVQTDTALSLQAAALHTSVAAEAAAAAELLLSLSPFPTGMPHMAAYRRAFKARYGPYRQVPLLELLDPSTGLGEPSAHGTRDSGTPSRQWRDRALLDLALKANREHRTVLELNDDVLARLATSEPSPENVPPSLDLSFSLAATSPTAIDRGHFQLVVGPQPGAPAAGRTLGRFADLLGPAACDALAELARTEQEREPHVLFAEVVYAPNPPRSANVGLRPAVRDHQIVVDAWPGTSAQGVIPVSELVVGLRADRFVIGWPAGGVEVSGVQGHMLNPRRAPAAARFLLEATHDGRCQLTSFSWGPAAGFSFLPRVQRGRTVLSLAQWRLNPADVLGPGSGDDFTAALSAWQTTWDVPRHLYLSVGDNRLLLDLHDSRDVELLREELKTVSAGQSALLHEALPGSEHAWLTGTDGGHMCEVVAPMVRRRGKPSRSSPPLVTHTVEPEASLRPPGSDWLYLKLYCDPRHEDHLIGSSLDGFGKYVTQSGLSDGWFFVRYADPEHHVRLRFHGNPATLIGPLMEHACAWAGGLQADGFCTRFSFETYEREVDRYGGWEGMAAAEALFMADSPSVAAMLRAHSAGWLGVDLLELAVISMDDLLSCLGLSHEERAVFSYGGSPQSRVGGSEYRRRKNELRQALGASLPANGEVSRLLSARRSALEPAIGMIKSLHRDGRLLRSVNELSHSYVHLHANRLFGTDSLEESLAVELLRRTRASLIRAPVTWTPALEHPECNGLR